MLRYEPLAGTIRFYESAEPSTFEPYAAVCTVVWESPAVAWITAMHGAMPRAFVRDLARLLTDLGAVYIKAHRADNRSLPFGRDMGDHILIDLSDWALRRWAGPNPPPPANPSEHRRRRTDESTATTGKKTT